MRIDDPSLSTVNPAGYTALAAISAAGNTNVTLPTGPAADDVVILDGPTNGSRNMAAPNAPTWFLATVSAGSGTYAATLALQNTNARAGSVIEMLISMPASTNPTITLRNLTSGGTVLGTLSGLSSAAIYSARLRFDGTNWKLLSLVLADLSSIKPIALSGNGADLTANSVANAKLAQMAGLTVKGNNTGSTANAADLTESQLKAAMNLSAQFYPFTFSSAPAGATGGSGSWAWSIPSWAKKVEWVVIGGGGGGGSGRLSASGTAASGGGGGGNGIVGYGALPTSFLASLNLSVTVGAGGAGGAVQSTNDTNGNAGSTGTISTIVASGKTYATSGFGNGGAGGTTTTASGGSNGGSSVGFTFLSFPQTSYFNPSSGAGGNGQSTAAGSTPSAGSYYGMSGGGGGVDTGGTTYNGGAGGSGLNALAGGSVAGGSGGTAPGGNGSTGSLDSLFPWASGSGGGAGSATGNGGTGAAAAGYGVGGAGGGGALNGHSSGAGGKGGDGYVLIICYP